MNSGNFEHKIEPLISQDEAARILGFQPTTVSRMAFEGRLPAVRFPTRDGKYRYKYRISELQNYIESLRVRRPVQSELAAPTQEERMSA